MCPAAAFKDSEKDNTRDVAKVDEDEEDDDADDDDDEEEEAKDDDNGEEVDACRGEECCVEGV